MRTISIIGGGAAGALVLINMLKYFPEAGVTVKWIEKSGEFGTGVAYSTDKDYHLLNVPANSMGLFHDYANDFFEWQLKKGYSYSEHDYVPRKIYGEYLKEHLFYFLRRNENISIELIQGEVEDVTKAGEGYILSLKNKRNITTNTVIFATGNFAPSDLPLPDMSYTQSRNYFKDPWDNEINRLIKRTDDVLIIGTGLTMVDKILDFYHQLHKGKIYAISRKGYLPFTHYPCSRHQRYLDYTEELLHSADIHTMYNHLRKHIDTGIKSGIDWRVVVDTLRPSLPAIWNSLSLQDKEIFLRRFSSLWTVVRHRIPVICTDILHLLKEKKQLQVSGGRIVEIVAMDDGIEVQYLDRKTAELKQITVQKIINCSGPQLNIARSGSTLYKNLLKKHLLFEDELHMGFRALPDGRLLDGKGQVIPGFYTIGNGLRGVLFESSAIPEIRGQAYRLVKHIMVPYAATV